MHDFWYAHSQCSTNMIVATKEKSFGRGTQTLGIPEKFRQFLLKLGQKSLSFGQCRTGTDLSALLAERSFR